MTTDPYTSRAQIAADAERDRRIANGTLGHVIDRDKDED